MVTRVKLGYNMVGIVPDYLLNHFFLHQDPHFLLIYFPFFHLFYFYSIIPYISIAYNNLTAQSRCHPAKSSSSESSTARCTALATLSLLCSFNRFPACFLWSATSFASLHYFGRAHTLITFPFELVMIVYFSSK